MFSTNKTNYQTTGFKVIRALRDRNLVSFEMIRSGGVGVS